MYIDLDDFKGINDSLGHDAGDLLLKEIAKRLKCVGRQNDFVARLSGDEFCLLIKHVDDCSAATIAQRCLATISQPVEISTRKITPACSIGIAHYPEDGQDLTTLLKAADTSLYAAKEEGKNQYAFYRPELTRQAEYRFRVEQNLREAIERNQLSLVYQPQINIGTHEIVGLEALSRWYHPQLGQVEPTDFIATAERIGIMKPLTEWLLRTACKQAVGLVALIRRILDETGMVPEQLELEVTESVVHTNQRNLSIFRDLKKLGVLLAIDDFGTGYSSFSSLKHLTVDYLKIDKCFIHDMLVDKKVQHLIQSMIEIGQNLGHGVIAEGVEAAEQLHILQQLDCDIAQGYLFSKPVSADEISKLLQSNLDYSRSQL